MRLYVLEMKKMIKSRRTRILLAVALLLSVVMAYLPISFESINRPGEHGTVVELNGLEAIQWKRSGYQKTYGGVTPEKAADALRTYQKYVQEYGTIDDIPLDIYLDYVMPIRPMIKGLPEAFADPKTGMGADLMEMDPDEVERYFYERCAAHLEDIMDLEHKDDLAAGQFAADKYSRVKKPFQLYAGFSRDAFDYIELYLLLLSILFIAIAAPTFAGEYQTGSNSISRCAKYGRRKLAVIRILASYSIFTVVFLLAMVIQLSILNFAFGPDCLKTSFQMLFSIISLPDISLGQLQVILVLGGLLSVLASISCTMFLSAKCRDPLTVLLVSVAVLLLPSLVYLYRVGRHHLDYDGISVGGSGPAEQFSLPVVWF